MFSTEHPQTTELVALEQEKETFQQEALNYKAKLLQLEEGKGELVTRKDKSIKHGCCCTFYYKN
jgi:hypothetical protein